ncbi:hypothetical protein Tco_1230863 [Tanacetum coccineum]
MTTLQFGNTHNLVAFLAKPAECKGFEQIVDFLNANPIRYALTINPTIYTSCIEQFWATAKVKTVNREVLLQALVDGKKIIDTEASVRRDLQLNDEEGTDCLPNATIFEELTRMGYEKLSHKLTFYKEFFSPQWKFLIHTILQFLSAKTTAWNKFSSTMASAIICLATNQKFNFSKYIFESMVKNLENVSGKFLMYPSGPTSNVVDEAVNEEMDDSLVRAATTATSLDVEQDRGNINKTQSKATPNESSSLGTSSGGGPRRQETMGDTIAQIGFENVSKTSNDSLLTGVNTPRSDEDRLKLNELMKFYIKLQQRVLDLENTKTTQAQEITSLKLRVNKLEKKGGSRTHKLKRLYKVGRSTRVISSDEASLGDHKDASKQGRKIDDIDKDAEITLVDETQGRCGDEEMFDTGVLDGDEVLEEPEVTVKDVHLSVDEVTLAQALAALKSAKEKGKGIMVEEPVKMKKKDQISLDEELALKLQAKLEEEDRLLFDKAMKRVNTFVDMDTKLVEGSETRIEGSAKRAGKDLQQESIKKQKVDEHKETAELQRLIEVVPDKEEVAIDAIPLATKPPSIIDYKIHKEGKKTYY